MEFSEVLQNRRSIRCFNHQPIDRETLIDIIRDAQQTPSWANSQPWHVYLATGATLDSIKAEHHAASSQGERGQAKFSTMQRGAWAPETRENMGNWNSQIRGHLGTDHADEYGDVASTRTMIENWHGYNFIEYQHLVKDRGGWKITSRTCTEVKFD